MSTVAEWKSIDLRFGDREVFDNFSLRVDAGERVVLRGPSGRGKSSLFRLLLGFEHPDRGEVRFHDRRIDRESVWMVRRDVAFVPQQVGLGDGTVRDAAESILGFRANRGTSLDPGEFERLGLAKGVVDQAVSELSGGEGQRVGLALALMLRREVFLLDEPTAALDADSRAAVRQRFAELPDGCTVIVIAHDPGWSADARVVDL